jgi:hypothetical protein
MAETFRKFDKLFVAKQVHDIPQPIVYSIAVITGLKVFLDPKLELRRHIALEVTRQLTLDLIAIDPYETRFARHDCHRSIRCSSTEKVTSTIIFFSSAQF